VTAEPEIDVLVIGGGPAGLAAAVAARTRGRAGRVAVLEREAEVGGIPRHTAHTGYGARELHRLVDGPTYARRISDRARRAGVELHTRTTVTGWDPGARLVSTTAPDGIRDWRAGAIVLATGCRERPRSARLVPGSRPLGVLTTGALQQLTALHRARVGTRAVVVGAEHVSFSAVLTLHHAGCAVATMVTDQRHHQSYAVLRAATAGRHRVPVLTGSAVTRILGRRRVEAVEITDLASGATRQIACDTVVFTGDWIPDHELARRGGLTMDTGTRGPRVDLRLRTSATGVFAAGNLVHAAETAGVCARDGAVAGVAAAAWARAGAWPERPPLAIECDPPLRWLSPNAAVAGETGSPHGHFVLRSDAWARTARLRVEQAGRVLGEWSRRLVPNRPVHLPDTWLGRVDAEAGPVRISVPGA
jgi:thioredoxin reductase